ncbi:MAG: hypothetical protein R3F11_32785 [Verrucomicrobiales bacterium]
MRTALKVSTMAAAAMADSFTYRAVDATWRHVAAWRCRSPSPRRAFPSRRSRMDRKWALPLNLRVARTGGSAAPLEISLAWSDRRKAASISQRRLRP